MTNKDAEQDTKIAVIGAAVALIGIIVAMPQDADAFTEDGLLGAPCATHEVASVAVQEVSIKPEEDE